MPPALAAMPQSSRGRRRNARVLLAASALIAFYCVSARSVPAAFAPPTRAAGFVEDNSMILTFAIMGFCACVATTEVARKPPMPVPIDQRADYFGVLLMSALLSLLSGMVNAMAILDMGMTVAHHTGNASHTGRLLGENAARFFMLMLAFAVGAAVVGYSKSDGEAVYSRRFSPGLLSASVAVAGGCVIRWLGGDDKMSINSTLILWAFSQGIQNAISRKCSSLPVCTTHMTGYLTDFGSGLGAAVQASVSGETPLLRKPLFFGLSIFTFGFGGYIMKLARPHYGAQAVLAAAVVMCAVALGLVPIVPSGSKKCS